MPLGPEGREAASGGGDQGEEEQPPDRPAEVYGLQEDLPLQHYLH